MKSLLYKIANIDHNLEKDFLESTEYLDNTSQYIEDKYNEPEKNVFLQKGDLSPEEEERLRKMRHSIGSIIDERRRGHSYRHLREEHDAEEGLQGLSYGKDHTKVSLEDLTLLYRRYPEWYEKSGLMKIFDPTYTITI